MEQEDVAEMVESTFMKVRELFDIKGDEYVRNQNPFHNFEVGARKKGISREKVLDGFLLKHEISIEDMTNDLDHNVLPSESKLDEKFLDNIVYLLLKKAMILDRIRKQ